MLPHFTEAYSTFFQEGKRLPTSGVPGHDQLVGDLAGESGLVGADAEDDDAGLGADFGDDSFGPDPEPRFGQVAEEVGGLVADPDDAERLAGIEGGEGPAGRGGDGAVGPGDGVAVGVAFGMA